MSVKPIKMNQMIKMFSSQFVLGCVILVLSGCSSLDLISQTWNWEDFKRADEKNPAVKMLCAWEAVEGTGLDGMPARGFAGQILFFNRQDAEPVVVEGNVSIFVFDDVGTVSEQAKPIRQFDFIGQAWNFHAKQTTLGPSYNIFIPYTRENYHYLTNCVLRVKLTTKNGRMIYSHFANIPLPGPKRPTENGVASNQNPIGSNLLQAGQQGAAASIGQQLLNGSNVNTSDQNTSSPQFQTRKNKMQHVAQMYNQYMQSQKSPAVTNRATPHILAPQNPQILSQPARMNTFSDPGPQQTGQFASVNYGLTPQRPFGRQVQPIATEIDPVESRYNSYQSESYPQSTQPHPIQQGHPLKSGFNPIPQSVHPLSPNRNSSPSQQYNRLPASNSSQPVFNPEQASSPRHPLGQLQQHPLGRFSSQYVPTGRQSRLQPTVKANAAPLRQSHAANWNLSPRTLGSSASQNAAMDQRLSFAGR